MRLISRIFCGTVRGTVYGTYSTYVLEPFPRLDAMPLLLETLLPTDGVPPTRPPQSLSPLLSIVSTTRSMSSVARLRHAARRGSISGICLILQKVRQARDETQVSQGSVPAKNSSSACNRRRCGEEYRGMQYSCQEYRYNQLTIMRQFA